MECKGRALLVVFVMFGFTTTILPRDLHGECMFQRLYGVDHFPSRCCRAFFSKHSSVVPKLQHSGAEVPGSLIQIHVERFGLLLCYQLPTLLMVVHGTDSGSPVAEKRKGGTTQNHKRDKRKTFTLGSDVLPGHISQCTPDVRVKAEATTRPSCRQLRFTGKIFEKCCEIWRAPCSTLEACSHQFHPCHGCIISVP